MLANDGFRLTIDEKGFVRELVMQGDPHEMNWVIDEDYLKQVGYEGHDKLFGHFQLTTGTQEYRSVEFLPVITESADEITVTFSLPEANVTFSYRLAAGTDLDWQIHLENTSSQPLAIKNFGVWAAFAYVMFRDKNVLRNIHQSAAVFPAISTDYTKINAVRRGNVDGNLGLYQRAGRTLSVGTYCEYENLFFENVSPSLDGILYHQLILAGGYPEGFENRDWLYAKDSFTLAAGEVRQWAYTLNRNDSKEEFAATGATLGHPVIDYAPLNILGAPARLSIRTAGHELIAIHADFWKNDKQETTELTALAHQQAAEIVLDFVPQETGEHKIRFTFADGSEDFVIVNVMENLAQVIEERAAYICDSLYQGPEGDVPYAFSPISNQGESLGKLNLVLKKNLLGTLNPEEVRKVEASAVNYVRPKWFIDGNFFKPRNLYGDFYRCMDFEYIGHLFYLLSEFDDSVLAQNDAATYLSWAADVFNLRVNPDLHETERGKEEAQMLGVYFLYIQDLLTKLKEKGLTETYETIDRLWKKVTTRVNNESPTYKAAITEHFYDNAGFGPTAGALSETGLTDGAERYGQLLLANIGYSNDFRGQNPDRWWEALTYMIHSLWGGVTAAACFKVYEFLKDPAYLEASYRATAGILYCYDTHATACLPLEKGMAASTYAVAGPHLNRPDLSRERFGQATFWRDGGIFARLFENDTQTPDWDMGEELVAYLDGLGQKTFLVKKADRFEVINGSFAETPDGLTVTSFAPYPKEYYLVEGKKLTLLKDQQGLRQLALTKEGTVK